MTKFKKQNALPCKFQKKKKKKIQRAVVSLFHITNIGEAVKNSLVLSKYTLKPGSMFIKFLAKVVRKLEKLKSQNYKSCMFDGPVIKNRAFS